MKYLLDVTLLASCRAYHFARGPPQGLSREQPFKENGGESSSVSLPPPVTFVLMMEPPPVPVTEQGLYLRHFRSLLQLPCEVGSMVMSPSQGRKLT